jgi:hypothetical protein
VAIIASGDAQVTVISARSASSPAPGAGIAYTRRAVAPQVMACWLMLPDFPDSRLLKVGAGKLKSLGPASRIPGPGGSCRDHRPRTVGIRAHEGRRGGATRSGNQRDNPRRAGEEAPAPWRRSQPRSPRCRCASVVAEGLVRRRDKAGRSARLVLRKRVEPMAWRRNAMGYRSAPPAVTPSRVPLDAAAAITPRCGSSGPVVLQQ